MVKRDTSIFSESEENHKRNGNGGGCIQEGDVAKRVKAMDF